MSKKFIVLDTETAPLTPGNGTDPRNSRVYDFGFVVADKDGVVYEKRSLIIGETFANAKLMMNAYYRNKLPQYYEGMRNGEWEVVTMLEAFNIFRAAIEKWGVHDFYAYNAKFDRAVLNATLADYSNGFRSFFFPYGSTYGDIWDIAGATICNTKKYVKWCAENGYMSEKGNPKTSAEVVYRYITKNHEFVERHTALSDSEIELSILLKALKRKKKNPHTIGAGWRGAANIAKQLRKEGEII